MKNIAVFGAGIIGSTVVKLLLQLKDKTLVNRVYVVDQSQDRLDALFAECQRDLPGCALATVRESLVSIENGVSVASAAIAKYGSDVNVVINALPHFGSAAVAERCVEGGMSYFDLSEDVSEVAKIKQLESDIVGRNILLAPQQGLAPGAVDIIAWRMLHEVPKDRWADARLNLYVGALTEKPEGPLKYTLTWSVDGVVNEYYHSSRAIIDGKVRLVEALHGRQQVTIEGVEYDAAFTAGGLGSLTDDLDGVVDELTYRSLRFYGHYDKVSSLVSKKGGLGLSQALVRDIFKEVCPTSKQDEVVMGVRVNDILLYSKRFKATDKMSAIQLTTASGLLATLELYLRGQIKQTGFLSHVDIPYDGFIATQYGQVYAPNE